MPEFSKRLEDLPQEIYRSQAEVCFAAGEVAELLGRTATNPDFATSCYARADNYFLRALELLKFIRALFQEDGGYLTRAYQRYALVLAERIEIETTQGQEMSQGTQALLALCKQYLLPPVEH